MQSSSAIIIQEIIIMKKTNIINMPLYVISLWCCVFLFSLTLYDYAFIGICHLFITEALSSDLIYNKEQVLSVFVSYVEYKIGCCNLII